jgi:hypothetical protein
MVSCINTIATHEVVGLLAQRRGNSQYAPSPANGRGASDACFAVSMLFNQA